MHRKLTSGELAAAVPAAIQALPRWVGHRNKQPIDVKTGTRRASVSEAATWGTFGQALEWYERHPGDPELGIGFVFTKGDSTVFVDLDGALDEQGDVKPWAADLVSRLGAATYLEVSPSRKGLHAFLLGELPRSEGVTGGKAQPAGAVGAEKIEVYAERRFSTVTGWWWAGSQADLGPAGEVLPSILFETGLAGRLLRSAAPAEVEVQAEPEGARDLTEREDASDREDELRRVQGALACLDPDCGYEEWVQVGMALKAGLGEDGRDLWLGWSEKGAKCKPGEPEAKWSSFRGSGIGLGTLFQKAIEAGYDARKSALDEFAGVDVSALGLTDSDGGADGEEGIPYHTAVVGAGKRSFEVFVKGHENAFLYFARDKKWKGRLRWNERKGEVELDGRTLRDHDLVDLSGAVSRALDWNPAVGLDVVFKAVVRAAQASAYDPVRDWLKGLVWDGTDRLEGFCRAVGLEDSDTTRRYLRLWALGAVARAFEPGCSMPYVLVLCGPQGAGKSRLAQALAMRPEWYHESAVTLGDKDAYLATLGPWIMEIAELAGMRRTDQERVKAFVSERVARFRAPYGRVQEEHPRRVVFIATTNDEEYGRDSTGARRWLDIAVTGEMSIPTPGEMAQLWAQAVVVYRRGERRYENAGEMAETNARGEARRELDPVEEAANEVLRELARQGATTIAEVNDLLKQRTGALPRTSRPVTQALRKAGWQQRKFRATAGEVQHRLWVVPDAPKEAYQGAVDRRRGYQVADN